MKKSKIFFIIILFLFSIEKIFAQNNGSYNINYSENFPNNIGIFQSLNNGWASSRNTYKNIMTPEWCKKITSNRGELFFIPTKTTNEWNNFKSHLPSGIGIGSCDLICNPNFHKEWNSCISNTKSCTITNWVGQQTWNGSSWWSCQVMSCNSWYNKVWNSCIKINNNCSTRNMNDYNIPAVNHWNSIQITKTINWSPVNWSTTYTATASCNNGNITISWENSRINCGSGYENKNNQCVKKIEIPKYPACDYQHSPIKEYILPKTQLEKEEMIKRIINLNSAEKHANGFILYIPEKSAPDWRKIEYRNHHITVWWLPNHLSEAEHKVRWNHYICFWQMKLPEIANHPVSN